MKTFGTNEKGNINDFEVVCTSCGSHNCEVFTTHFYGSHDLVHPKAIKMTFRCKRCKKEYSCTIHDDVLRVDNKPYVYAIRIFNKDGYQPMAELVFGDGGKPSAETKIIRWDDVDERSKYVINAYTLVWDERDAVKIRSFEEYIGRTKNSYSACDVLGYCPFDNKVEGFPCQDCSRKDEE